MSRGGLRRRRFAGRSLLPDGPCEDHSGPHAQNHALRRVARRLELGHLFGGQRGRPSLAGVLAAQLGVYRVPLVFALDVHVAVPGASQQRVARVQRHARRRQGSLAGRVHRVAQPVLREEAAVGHRLLPRVLREPAE
eukprot:2493384-Prymnesium_polylepis.1